LVQKERFPKAYLKFQRDCRWSIPSWLVGTDIAFDLQGFNSDAVELLKEADSQLELDSDDFVFLMHQGYIFYFFKLNGDENPKVFGYSEGHTEFKCFGSFTEFIKNPSD
jgi:hypothetical protein